MKHYLLAAIAVFALGCTQEEVAQVTSTEQATSSVRAPVGQPYTFSVSNPNLYMSYAWSLRDKTTGADVSGLCGDPAGQNYDCTVGLIGLYTATVIAEKRSGGSDTQRFTVDFFDAINVNQAPRIRFAVCDAGGFCGADIDQFSISGSTELEIGAISFRFFDSSNPSNPIQTVDDNDTASNLLYEVSIDGGPFDTYTSGNALIFNTPGIIPVTVRVTDSGGAYSLRSFAMNMTCTSSEAANLSIGTPTIDSDNGNIVVYDATNQATAARGPLLYSWDFNADNLEDGIGEADAVWTSNPRMMMVNLLDGQRQYRLTVFDQGCNITTSKTFLANPDIGRITPLPNIGDNVRAAFGESVYFLQANVDPGAGNFKAHADAEYIAKQTDSNIDIVDCDYSPNGQFTIRGDWNYNKLGAVNHGMEVTIGGIDDSIVQNQIGTPQTVTGGQNLVAANYISDKAEDQLNNIVYAGPGSCQLSATVVGLPPGTIDCDGEQVSAATAAVEIHGTFNCNPLNGGGSSVGLSNGAFYCQVQSVARCPGGGGGGGGGVPPIPE